ncbi:MAG: hypothetical protein HY318_14950, partial [Armatimonadetes bacterium]|nr:hypothetical protein [Armatimonadota bacterium]
MGSRLALLISAVVILGVSLEAQISFAQESRQISRLKPLHLATQLWDSNRPTATIVAGSECQGIAVDLQRSIKRLTGVLLPLVPDVNAQRDLPKPGNLIALGHFGNNRILERLYYRWYMVVDGAQPGAGGYVLQTIHNPDAEGANVIVVGGSDMAGVRNSAQRLVERIKEHGRLLPRLFEVELGEGKEEVLARGEQVLEPKREWPTVHPMEIQQAISEAGTLYVYT